MDHRDKFIFWWLVGNNKAGICIIVFLISQYAILFFLIGMDFRDFFIFMIRFALANFVLLYQLTSRKGFINTSSSEMAQLLLFNLKNIKCVTLKMKSEAAWQNCSIVVIDLVQTIKDQSFMEFFNTLGRTFSMMCNLGDINFNQSCPPLEYEQISVLYPFGSRICNPDNLVTFLDYAFKLVDTEG